ncbi:bifunctional glutamate--cysteine ligase GshA/glutathione synthetase GshB [Clostridium sp.]|uniref:bifunctional glutamate--cysteine ligase GshA/glutathione synthetase GshB n=1 Tax=Clostridium sp. TaxID=1506 RepID=UPI00321709E2
MIDKLKKLIDNKIPLGSFGIEREALRVDGEGRLSLKPHPKGLGEKSKNPYITTDFSESQVEVITPVFDNVEEVYNFLNILYDIVVEEIGDEYLWPQSMPCIIPEIIPVAEFGEDDDSKEATKYREKLLDKYGGKKQLISGIHYNFSFNEELIKELYKDVSHKVDYKTFKDNIYLKITRNYLRYRWLIVYLLGSTTTLHSTYIEECECRKCFKEVAIESYSHEGGISYRNGECGYKNLVDLFPDYNSAEGYVRSLKDFIRDGLIESHKEVYSQIRLKPKNPKEFFNSLIEDGIKYLEYRTIDVNPFEKCGISLEDLKFLEVFNLFLLLKEEDVYKMWQEESLENQNLVAKFGKKDINLKRNGEYILKSKWALEILNEIREICKELRVHREFAIDEMEAKVKNVNLTYAHRIEERVKKEGYVETYLTLAKKYKEEANKDTKGLLGYGNLERWAQQLIRDAIKNGGNDFK